MTAVAAHVTALDLRGRPSLPWARSSGEQPNGALTVEINVGGWVDLTAMGLVRAASQVRITRGQPDETSAANPGTCSLTLENTNGALSPRNPLGPWYGQLKRNTPLRVSVQSGNTRSYRFAGEVPAWPSTWDPTGVDVTVPIQASGILRRLSQGQTPLRSSPYLYWAYASPANAAVAYWPCEDGSSATQVGSGIGGSPMAITGGVQMANYADILFSESLPVLASGSLRGTVPVYTPDPALGSSVVFLLAVPAAGETAQVLCRIGMSGAVPVWEVYYTTGSNGGLGMRAKDASGAITADTGTIGTGVNGKSWAVAANIYEDPAGFATCSLIANPTDVTLSGMSGGAAVGQPSVGRVTSVTMGPGNTLTGTAVGHVAVMRGTAFSIFDLLNAYTGYTGEAVSARFPRLCTLVGIPSVLSGSTVTGGVATFMGPQRPLTVLQLLQEIVDADCGILYELPDQVGLGYRTHNNLGNQAAVLALDYSAAQLSQVPVPTDDDSFTRNDVTTTRPGGSFARAQMLTGPMGVTSPPGGVGRYDTSVATNVDLDTHLYDRAAWRMSLGTTDEPRFPVIAVQLSRAPFTASSTLRPAALAVNLGDRLTLANTPVQLPPDGVSALALGVTETIDKFLHEIVWNTTPESPYHLAILEDPVLGRADTDGSILAFAAGQADTTLLVATVGGQAWTSPLWTTSAGEFPFDILVGGERMTVTNITGASSPQTFTVTRSVNGIVKGQPANTDVRLFQPMIPGF